jgi:hypothetical protein
LGLGSRGNPSWTSWQAYGFDTKGVSADPRFVNAARDDFRLRDDSPAFKAGFQRIPIEKFGLYKDDLRAAWPVKDTTQRVPLTPAVYDFPIPGWTRQAAPVKVALVPQVISPMTRGSGAPLIINKGIEGEAITPASQAWMGWDNQNLYVVFRNDVNPAKPLATKAQWGANDAVEIALRDPSRQNAPILVWRGYPNGNFETSTEAGASEQATARAAVGVSYNAQIENASSWTATWQIPFVAIGVSPALRRHLDCNLTVRKTVNDQWVMWLGTNGHSWDVSHAGQIVLGPPEAPAPH